MTDKILTNLLPLNRPNGQLEFNRKIFSSRFSPHQFEWSEKSKQITNSTHDGIQIEQQWNSIRHISIIWHTQNRILVHNNWQWILNCSYYYYQYKYLECIIRYRFWNIFYQISILMRRKLFFGHCVFSSFLSSNYKHTYLIIIIECWPSI